MKLTIPVRMGSAWLVGRASPPPRIHQSPAMVESAFEYLSLAPFGLRQLATGVQLPSLPLLQRLSRFPLSSRAITRPHPRPRSSSTIAVASHQVASRALRVLIWPSAIATSSWPRSRLLLRPCDCTHSQSYFTTISNYVFLYKTRVCFA